MPDNFETLSEKILRLTMYGGRYETPEEPSVFLSWSNGGRRWAAFERIREPGEEVFLDANQCLAVGMSMEEVKKILPDLPMLPLYANSFEAKFGPI
jgi:hypothetical protein